MDKKPVKHIAVIVTVVGTSLTGLVSAQAIAPRNYDMVRPIAGWTTTGPLRPDNAVPLDGYISLGLSFEDAGCDLADERLNMLDVVVTLAGAPVAGTVLQREELFGDVIWQPDEALQPNRSYVVTPRNVLIDHPCIDGIVELSPMTFQTGSETSQEAPAIPPLDVQQRGGPGCGPDVTSFNFGSQYSPYLAFEVVGGGAENYTFHLDTAGLSLERETPDTPHCVTLRATHLLNGQTVEEQICTSDATMNTWRCGRREEGCSGGGPPGFPLSLALAAACLWTIHRRRAATVGG